MSLPGVCLSARSSRNLTTSLQIKIEGNHEISLHIGSRLLSLCGHRLAVFRQPSKRGLENNGVGDVAAANNRLADFSPSPSPPSLSLVYRRRARVAQRVEGRNRIFVWPSCSKSG